MLRHFAVEGPPTKRFNRPCEIALETNGLEDTSVACHPFRRVGVRAKLPWVVRPRDAACHPAISQTPKSDRIGQIGQIARRAADVDVS